MYLQVCGTASPFVLYCLFFSLFAALILGTSCAIPVDELPCRQLKVELKVELEYAWKPLVPTGAEDKQPGFTPLLCVAHGPKYHLWQLGEPASPGIQSLLKTQDFKTIIDNITKSDRRNHVGSWSKSEMTEVPSPGSDFVNITIDPSRNTTLVSCIAGVVPSPDWFVGFSAFEMCPIRTTTIPLRSFDADFDDLDTFIGQSIPVTTPGKIHHRFGMGNDLGSARLVTLNTNHSEVEPSDGALENFTGEERPPSCFPASARLTMADGTWRTMRDLRVGETVVTGLGTASVVFAFSHRDRSAVVQFVRATYSTFSANITHSLTASPSHLVYALRQGSQQLVPMSLLEVGDALIGVDGCARQVVKTVRIVSKGLYNPHTLSGDIVVDGILVSCYTTALSPMAATGALFPLRVLHGLRLSGLARALSEYSSLSLRCLETVLLAWRALQLGRQPGDV